VVAGAPAIEHDPERDIIVMRDGTALGRSSHDAIEADMDSRVPAKTSPRKADPDCALRRPSPAPRADRPKQSNAVPRNAGR
jgi:hypothetical protein